MKIKHFCERCTAECSGKMEKFQGGIWNSVCSRCYKVLLPGAAVDIRHLHEGNSYLLRKLEFVRKPTKIEEIRNQDWFKW